MAGATTAKAAATPTVASARENVPNVRILDTGFIASQSCGGGRAFDPRRGRCSAPSGSRASQRGVIAGSRTVHELVNAQWLPSLATRPAATFKRHAEEVKNSSLWNSCTWSDLW
ncbi:hypothetical protein GOPIP_097_00040 [Gordonia polyisoprenivorans NBRC 16320 = JCM 10675]|nr:hypothetical protein GOPIP_097_00040 [Gordonia polyisoprenivorans NBRC 16320 = JCM 10675]